MAFRDDHRVFDTLRLWIISGRLESGQHLLPGELAEELASSTVPVREALIRLAERGMVDYARGKGFAVARTSVNDQIEMIRLASHVFDRGIRSAATLPFLQDRIDRYTAFVNARLEEHRAEYDLAEACLAEFKRLFLSEASRFVLNKVLDVGFMAKRIWADENGERVVHAVTHGSLLINERRFDELADLITADFDHMVVVLKEKCQS
ncbi:GntR family transcriptional regulator [Kushneria sp. AK178]